MGDIALCENKDCPRYKICYRADDKHKPDRRQTYFAPEFDEGGCEYFMVVLPV